MYRTRSQIGHEYKLMRLNNMVCDENASKWNAPKWNRAKVGHVKLARAKLARAKLNAPNWHDTLLTYLLLNSDYGIGCVYSPLGLMIFVAVEGTFVCFTKGHDHFISNCIRCGCLRNDQCNIACLQTEMHSQLAAAPLRGGEELCRVISAVLL